MTSKSNVEIIPLGIYSNIYNKSRNEPSVDMPCWLKKGENTHPSILMAYGNDDIRQLYGLEPFHLYETDIEIRQNGDVYKAKVDKHSTFTEVLEGAVQERTEQVLSFYPHVPLAETDKHFSMLEKNGKDFVDKTDLKVLQAYINSTDSGTSENGIDWARLEVVDESFNPTDRPFIAWVNPQILQKAGTGQGSFVYLLGTLEHDGYENTQMNVCNILPIVKRPPIEPEIANNPVRVLKILVE